MLEIGLNTVYTPFSSKQTVLLILIQPFSGAKINDPLHHIRFKLLVSKWLRITNSKL